MSGSSLYAEVPDPPVPVLRESDLESEFIQKLLDQLKYTHRPDICDRRTLELNFRQKFEALNRVRLTDSDCQAQQRPPTTRSHPAGPARREGQFARLLDDLVSPYVLKSAVCLRDWCNNVIVPPYQIYAVQPIVESIEQRRTLRLMALRGRYSTTVRCPALVDGIKRKANEGFYD